MADQPEAPRRIAVVQTAFLGDVVFTSPLVRLLAEAYPGAQITLVVRPRAMPLAGCIPGVDRVVAFDKHGADRGFSGLLRVARALERPDLAVVPHPSLRSALLARASGASVRVGHARPWFGWLYTMKAPMRPREPFVEQMLDLGRELGFEGPSDLALRAPPEALEEARVVLGSGRSIGLAVGSEWATKRWAPASFAALAERAHGAGLKPVLLGAPVERPLAEAVRAAAPAVPFLDLVGNTILQSVGAIAQMEAFVGGDSGLSHVARALGRPTVLLFGPTDPGAHRFEPHAQALRLGIDCQPCHPHGPAACPLGHHDCMRRLDPGRVWAAVEALLSRRGPT